MKTESTPYIIEAADALAHAQEGLAQGYSSFVINRRGAGDGSYKNAAMDLMTLSFLADMETTACIESDNETVYLLSGVRKSYYDFLREMEGAAEPTPDEPGRLSIPYAEGRRFSVSSWAERSEGVSVTNAAPELTDAVLTHSYPVHTDFIMQDGLSASVSVRRGRLLIIVTQGIGG